ncbi:MAG: amidase [SAR324 cluster bacterium]|nr:amidase [SAR324 cluster bacterium]
MPDLSLCYLSAVELARMIRERQVSAREVMEAHLAQIEKLNPKVNAVVTLAAEEALEEAGRADDDLARGEPRGVLHGLPVGIKDLDLTAGMRTTFGSPIHKDFVPERDDLIVERYRAAGAIVVGKTNTPEFGAGSQTFNEVFGETLNPYDLGKTCGGSSGGSAVALAARMLPLASGGDLGGSLRNPGNFCNIVGFRPSPGRVPTWPTLQGWWTLSVKGPLARTVEEVALQLTALAGPDDRSPISIREPGKMFARPLGRDFKGTRVAWSRDLGRYPVEPEVNAVIDGRRSLFQELGCEVHDDHPDFRDADEIFQVLRAHSYAARFGETLKKHRKLLKDTVIWNIEKGLGQDGPTVARAEVARTEVYHRVRAFFENYAFLVLPVSPVPPFPVEQRHITEINGQKLETYIDWMALCYAITITGHPAVSVPCGFTAGGLPVGVQIVGRCNGDFELLQFAHAFEQATRCVDTLPALAAP